MKNIQIIGGGLYGCLTAYHVAKTYPECQVDLIEAADHLMTAFDPISLAGQDLNNGFHGLEIPRSAGLLEFFTDVLGVDFEQKPNDRLLSIQGELISFEAPLAEWPEDLQAAFETKPPFSTDNLDEFWPLISPEYQELLKRIGARYSEETEDIHNLLLPWFFPADYVLLSEDEGGIFRNDVRSRTIRALYAHPKEHLFSILQNAMAELLESMGVSIHLGTKVKFNEGGMDYIQPEGNPALVSEAADKIFFCASLAIMLKDIDMDLFRKLLAKKRKFASALLEYDASSDAGDYFSEILCADEAAPFIARISAPTEFGVQSSDGKKLLQVELFVPEEEDLEEIEKTLPAHIARILKLEPGSDLKLLEMKITRDTFFPGQEDLTAASDLLDAWAEKHCSNLKIRASFKPINMAKTWIWAEENCKSI